VKPEPGDKTITVTRSTVAAAAHSVGIGPGDTAMFHSSLSSMGTVANGPDSVIDGFLDAVGPTGTVAAPTLWWYVADPPRTLDQWDPNTSPAYIGTIPEAFRQRPDSVRSDNPTHSVSAIGARAVDLTRNHGTGGLRPCQFGDTAFAAESPWERLYQWNAAYCFIGVDFTVCTIGHYVECRVIERALAAVPDPARRADLEGRLARWEKEGVYPRFRFRDMGEHLTELGFVRFGKIGSATLRCIRARDLVDNTLATLDAEPDKWFKDEFLAWLHDAQEKGTEQ